MIKIGFSILLSIMLLSCIDKSSKLEASREDASTYKAEVVQEKNVTPTVDIREYTLIFQQNENRKEDAEEILDLKRKWPLVMQMPNREGFDTILSRHFTFSGDGNLFNREDYIEDRIKPSDWKITYVKYDNLM